MKSSSYIIQIVNILASEQESKSSQGRGQKVKVKVCIWSRSGGQGLGHIKENDKKCVEIMFLAYFMYILFCNK